MKIKLLSIIIFLFTLMVSVEAYTYSNTSGYKLDMDFTNGGVQNTSTGLNTSTVIGGSETPMNSSKLGYEMYQGLLYIIWSNVSITGIDVTPPTIDCNVVYKGIEWGEVNCSTTESVNWSFSIIDNLTQDTIYIFDTRTENIRKFVGLKPSRPYTIRINATDTSSNIGDDSVLLRTKTGAEDMEIAMVIGAGLIVILFIVLTLASRANHPFLANFFFLGIFIFSTLLTNLLWKIAYINSMEYAGILLVLYKVMLIITMLMSFIVLLVLTVDAVKLRRWKGNPVDNYRDNIGKNE